MPPHDDGSGARWEHRDGQICHGSGPCGPGVGRQPHCDLAADDDRCDRDEGDHQHPGAIRRGGAVVAREVRRRGHVRGRLVQAELVALDVLHHQARLVAVIGRQQPHPDRAERDQPGASGLKRGQPLVTRQPGPGPHVKMQPERGWVLSGALTLLLEVGKSLSADWQRPRTLHSH
jgi:hypothetical protein